MSQPLILAIDTSCDETCASLCCGNRVLTNVISSQVNLHKPYGGVVPNLAKRAHEEKIDLVVKKALKKYTPSAIAVTVGPGLAPALEVGISFAKKLSLNLHIPLIAINHLEGHLLSFLANMEGTVPSIFPAIGLIASGGHTQLILVKKVGSYQLLGETLDDAAGEALDKLAKMLKLGYPGGPIIEQLARKASPRAGAKIPLPIPMQHSKDLNFSFSGLKTAAMYLIQKQGSELLESSEPTFTYDICASFQQAIAKSLSTKLNKAIIKYSPKSILLGGGVFSNLYLRHQIRKATNLPIFLPKTQKLFTDNAAMIGIAAFNHYLKQDFVKNLNSMDRQPNLNFVSRV